ncbi:MAG: helicase-exonuclease AddAB subunit AddA [Clostridia bacterium]|nr:helicase-exonuclease AddAB subunit AddA [Clostridia bacterium]
MGERIWTQQQRSAIDASGGTLLVSAAAGSGKTAVLVQRVIERLTSDDPERYCDADRLLIVTFTRAAAAEMKERISAELQKKLEQSPWDTSLRRQMILVKKAQICTIDSFCSKLVRENFYKLDIAPDFRIADDSELKILREECIDEVLERNYAEGDEDFFELVEQLIGDKNDSELSGLIKSLDFYIGSFPFPEDVMTALENAYSAADPCETVWGRAVLAYAAEAAAYGLECNAIACEISSSEEKLAEKYLPSFERDADILRSIESAALSGNWDDLYESSSRAVITPLGKVNKLPAEAELAKAARSVVEETMKEIRSCVIADSARFVNEISFTGRMVRKLMQLLREYYALMAEAKSRRRILDFTDLEHMAVNLLVKREETLHASSDISRPSGLLNGYCKTDTALAMTGQFDEIMLDEYQDTNAVQSLIFSAVARNPEGVDRRALTDGVNMFMVGDMKQSIYRFRKAVPELFMEKFGRYAPFTAEDIRYPALITLGTNFRSRHEVTDAINYFFRQIMSPRMGGVEYDETQALSAGAVYPESEEMTAELHFVLRQRGTELSGADMEAEYIASLIAKMISEGFRVTDKATGQLRPARCGDFCILRRGISSNGRSYADALEVRGIPSWISTEGGLLDTDESNVILSFLRVISNPLLDIPLMCVMMSPVFGFTPDEMARIRLKERSAPLYGAVMSMAKEGDAKCGAFLAEMERFRLLAATQPADRIIEEICYSTGYLAAVSAMRSGAIRKANVRLLCEFAAKCEGSGYFGIGAFVSTVDRMLEQGEDLPGAVSVTENSDVVRIMTIHKSKGLEFPICIVAGLGTAFKKDGEAGGVITHNDLGIGMKIKENGAWYETQVRKAIVGRSRLESLSEEMRILYVALTRAKEKLIMVATPSASKNFFNDAAVAVYQSGDGKISPFALSQCNSFASWLAMAALRHPDCGCLRERTYIPVDADRACECRLKAVIYEAVGSEEEDSLPAESTDAAQQSTTPLPDEALMAAIRERISFRYRFEALSGVPTKVTASELTKREHSGESVSLVRPAFMMSGGLTPTERGKALHKFMEFANFRAAAESPDQELKRLQKYGFLTENEANAVDTAKVTAFFNRMKPMLDSAREILREREFSVILDREHTSVVTGADIGEEPILLEGECDVVLVYSDGAVILDYKTDRISDPRKLAEHYGTQLRLYRYAMEKVLDMPVKGIYLYSFYLDQLIEV